MVKDFFFFFAFPLSSSFLLFAPSLPLSFLSVLPSLWFHFNDEYAFLPLLFFLSTLQRFLKILAPLLPVFSCHSSPSQFFQRWSLYGFFILLSWFLHMSLLFPRRHYPHSLPFLASHHQDSSPSSLKVSCVTQCTLARCKCGMSPRRVRLPCLRSFPGEWKM